MTIQTSMEHRSRVAVRFEDLALHWGSEFPVLATPALLGLIETACVRAADHALPDEQTTVGTGIDMVHLAPTPQGRVIEIAVRVVDVTGRRVTFHFDAFDAATVVATGTHYRAVVSKAGFMSIVSRAGSDPEIGSTGSGISEVNVPPA